MYGCVGRRKIFRREGVTLINKNNFLYKVQLHNLIFFAFHGIYEEEKILGNQFQVSLEVTISNHAAFENIEDTLNYISLFEIVKTKMNQRFDLLESLAQSIIHEVYSKDKRVEEIAISIKKMNPPIKGINGNVGITLQRKFNR